MNNLHFGYTDEEILRMNNLHYWVCAPEGASGHFLGHFLHPQFKATQTGLRVDNLSGNNPVFKYTGSNTDGHTHHMNLRDKDKIMIRVLTPTTSEKIKCVFNVNFKFDNCKFDSFQYVMDKHYDQLLQIERDSYKQQTKKWAIDLNYNYIFNLYKLIELYYNVNNEVCPDYKIKYAFSYINQHAKLYNRWEFRAMEQIFLFEYKNKLIESTSNKIRYWSVDDITEENWQNFLDKNLCLANYS